MRLNPSAPHSRHAPPRFCTECGKLLSRQSSSSLCKPCVVRRQNALRRGGPAPACVDCGKLLRHTGERCRPCFLRWSHLLASIRPKATRRKGHCADCGRTISARAQRCKSCVNRLRWSQDDPRRAKLHARNWRGGITPETRRLRHSAAYAAWRTAVFTRDGYYCECCGRGPGGDLEAHHIRPWATEPRLRFSVQNGLTLCVACHDKIHSKAGR